jgi:hypothetical protein
MKNRFALIGGLSALALANCVEETETAGPPVVGSPSDLSSFEGARVGQAEIGIRNLGYEIVRQDGLTSYWFNRETGACAAITTADGRYSDVTMLPAGDC